MKFSVITPNRNGARFLEESLRSVLAQRAPGIEIELIVLDAGSSDGSLEILRRHGPELARLVVEPDHGPASAINKGFALATGDIVSWLNADDRYRPGAFQRVAEVVRHDDEHALWFGHCRIIDQRGKEIRKAITGFKKLFYPISSRFTLQCINYVSQPAVFFRRSSVRATGPLREDLSCAWDYDFILRLWQEGGARYIPGVPLADFRWHRSSISARQYPLQFKEEYEAAREDAGPLSTQAIIHWVVRWAIVGSYRVITKRPGREKPVGNS
jgi:glycosyltransferase involved in cell wall biosynthesis